MNEIQIEDLFMIHEGAALTGMRHLREYGIAVYEFQIPGITCHLETCPAKCYGGSGRYFGDIPEELAERLKGYYDREIIHILSTEFVEVFGPRCPTRDDPAGFPYGPLSCAGDVELFFAGPPQLDIIWPKLGYGGFVSQRVKDLLDEHQVTGVCYHPVKRATIVGGNVFKKYVKNWKWSSRKFRKWVTADMGTPSPVQFYELEVIGPPASCGLRLKVVCEACGYTVHDVTHARCKGPVEGHNGNDFVRMEGLGYPVCKERIIDLLHRQEIRAFMYESASETVRSIIDEN